MKKVQIKFPKIELEVGVQDLQKELEFINMVEMTLSTVEFQTKLHELVGIAMDKVKDFIKLSYNRDNGSN